MSYPLENALYQWEEGHRRLQELIEQTGGRGRAIGAVDAIREELKRRIGPTFTAAELADLYGQGTDWCLEVAGRVAPEQAYDWDPQLITDAAFHIYLRGATDYAGGRVLPSERR